MLTEIILAIFLGILFGIFTGLLPGIHTNLIAFLLLAVSPSLLQYFSPFSLASFILAMTAASAFIDFIPSIYLGCPDESVSLSVLPGHSLLLKGQGHKAIFLSSLGALSSIILILLITPLFLFLPSVYPFLQRMMPFLLFWVCIFLIFREKENLLIALIIFFLSGILGILSLNLPLKQPLLCLLSGLFGSSSLAISVFEKTKIPEQFEKNPGIKKKILLKPLLLSLPSSCLCSFLPGLSNSEAAAISSLSKISRKQFLVLTGSISTLTLFLSLMTFSLIQKARTGTALAISGLIDLNFSSILPLFIIFALVSIISFFLCLFLSKRISRILPNINYSIISIATLLFLSLIILIFSGLLGIFVFLTATCLGITCQLFGVKRSLLMSCLILPTIFLYLPF